MTKIQFLTMVGCHNCEAARKIFAEILADFPKVQIKEIDIASEVGQALVSQYGIMASPGIIINGELFSMGGVDKAKLLEKLESLAT